MSYCTVDDVCTAFPRFVRNAANSIQDTQIQDWIDDRKARIRGAFLARLVDPDTLALTVDAGNFLRALNRDGAIADLGDALQGDVTLQPGEYSLAGSHRQSFERQIKESRKASTMRCLAAWRGMSKSSPFWAASPAAKPTAPPRLTEVRIRSFRRIRSFEW